MPSTLNSPRLLFLRVQCPHCRHWGVSYRVYLIEFLSANYSLIDFTMVRAASLLCDLNIDTSHAIVCRIFYFSSSNPTPRFGLGHNRSNRVDESLFGGPMYYFRFFFRYFKSPQKLQNTFAVKIILKWDMDMITYIF